MDFEQWLSAKGLDGETISDAMRNTLQAAWRAEQNPPKPGDKKKGEGGDDYDAVMEGFRIEEVRRKRITSLVAEAIEANPNRREELDAIGRKAISGKWDVRDTELGLLRASRPDAPTQITGVGGTASAAVMEAAYAQATGLASVETSYPEKVLEAAWKQFKGGMTLCNLIDTTARQNGYRGAVGVKVNMEEVMRFAFRRASDGGNFEGRADSSVSTVSIGGILSNVGNKKVRDAFNSVDQSWREIAARSRVDDFKQMTTYSLTGDMIYKEIAPGGYIEHGTLGETPYTNQARSFGRMLGLDRRDLINDNAGALDKVYKKMGRGGALKLNKVVWGKFLNNATFFSSGNGNVSTGAGSALGLAGLKAADGVFATIKDPDGELMGTTPVILLVPSALRGDAWTLVNSSDTNATTTADKPIGTRNPYTGKFKAVDSPYLQDSTLTGYSSTAWYLLADPNDVPVIEVVFLFGRELPLVESTEADFNQLGLQVRGVHDFGAELQEFRGGVRSAGS